MSEFTESVENEPTETVVPLTARDHRKAAQRRLTGKPGLTTSEKVSRMLAAIDHLNMAVAMLEAQEAVTEDSPAAVESAE